MAAFIGSSALLARGLRRTQICNTQEEEPKRSRRAAAESTDWIASSLSRRFGVGAGLAWAGFLAVGVVSEQIKTRLEASQQERETREIEGEVEVVLPNGITYYEKRIGGGVAPISGDLVVLNLRGTVSGGEEAFVDTFAPGGKPLALILGSNSLTRGMCEGVEYVLRKMKAGGKARIVVPPELGFGDEGAEFGGVRVPPSSTLEYIVQLDRVSIAPA